MTTSSSESASPNGIHEQISANLMLRFPFFVSAFAFILFPLLFASLVNTGQVDHTLFFSNKLHIHLVSCQSEVP